MTLLIDMPNRLGRSLIRPPHRWRAQVRQLLGAKRQIICHKSQVMKSARITIISERKKAMWYILKIQYYSAVKKSGIKSFAGKWMELEIMVIN